MCGITGLFAYRDEAASPELSELCAIRDYMRRRGPDSSGHWRSRDGRALLGHRRLSILDLSPRAAQPMRSADGRYTITFNGEIYNYRALRERLAARGHVFRTTSDTEVVLQLYAERGVEMLAELRGMFAFGIFDELEHRLVLARDPYGIKPLYYAETDGCLRFASQVRALLAGGRISSARDPAGDVGFFVWGSVPEPFTAFEAVRALPAGSYLRCDAPGGPAAVTAFFSIADHWSRACRASSELTPAGLQSLVREALGESVAHHMVSDVPVGAFLSGGVDSGALVALMAEQGVLGTEAITLGFDEFRGRAEDELPRAAELARSYGVVQRVQRVREAEFRTDLPAIFDAMDQPTIDGVNTWFVSKAAAQHGLKVAISGLGGDELFAGYPAFRDVPRLVRLAGFTARWPALGRAARQLASPLLTRAPGAHPKLAGLLEYGGTFCDAYLLKRALFMPWELDSILPSERVREGWLRLAEPSRLRQLLTPEPQVALAKVAVLEAAQYMRNQLLRDTDWASMAHSVEVRVPLVDSVLLTRLAPALAHARLSDGKRMLANSPRRALPSAITAPGKTGFSTPLASWLARAPELSAYRRVPLLAAEGCPWARRYAYAVFDRFG